MTDQLVCLSDVMATCAELLGSTQSNDVPVATDKTMLNAPLRSRN